MKHFITLIALIISVNCFAINSVELKQWVSPTFKDYDFRCLNVEEDHYRHGWMAFAKFFQCPEVRFAKDYNYECVSVIITDNEANVVKRMTLTRGYMLMSEQFLASLDFENNIYFFDINYTTIEPHVNDVKVSKQISSQYSWGYDSGVIFQNKEGFVSGFPAVCQFKNHFPEEG